jgi:hypothetical protein
MSKTRPGSSTGFAPSVTSLIASPPAGITITSEPSGADITMDGAFVGNTPSTIQAMAGIHAVKVTKGTLQWERNLSVQSGSVLNLAATLEEKAPVATPAPVASPAPVAVSSPVADATKP